MAKFSNSVDDKDFINAKAFLSQTSTKSGLNVYDHLANVLNRVLSERQPNSVDVIEEISKAEKQAALSYKQDTILNSVHKAGEIELAEIQHKLFSKGNGGEDAEPEEDLESSLPNLMELCYYFEQSGVGLSREEIVRVWLALKNLIEIYPIQRTRFWGKILGTEQNYIVAEVQFRDGEEDEDEQEGDEAVEDSVDKDNDDDEDGEHELVVDVLPKSDYKPPPPLPKEPKGVGVNKKSYFVCNEPGKPWVKLPIVTPAQIYASRRIKKYFTGRLDAPVISYPPFPGNESNYLRAQIARISASTQVSPVGFYQFDEDEDEPEEGAVRDNYIQNPEFESLSVKDLVDPSLTAWVHHVLHILPQGRCTWWNPVVKKEEVGDDEDEDEHEELAVQEPEVGPPLLTPLSEDADVNSTPPWTTRMSSKLIPQYAVAVIHSCFWPGAHAFASGRNFENVYIGWGHKNTSERFNPVLPQAPQYEFPNGPEITEVNDPTPEAEAALRVSEQPEVEEEAEDEVIADDAGGDDDEDDDE